jgi:hypothetical protein
MRDPADSDKGLHRLAAELSSCIFWDNEFGVETPSTYAKRRIVKPAEWHAMLDARMARDFDAAMNLIGQSSAFRCRDDAMASVGNKWGRSTRTVERAIRAFSVTAPSSY